MNPNIRIHPTSGDSSADVTPEHSGEAQPRANKDTPSNYVVQVPKDQIYRVPPPENAHKYDLYTRRGLRRRRSCCCCCLAWVFGFLALVAVAVGVSAGVVYFAYHPKMPIYSVAIVSVYGFNVSSLAFNGKSFDPEIDVTIRAENPNDKMEIQYLTDSSVNVYYSDVDLADGAWPPFRSIPRNVSWVWSALRKPGIRLSDSTRREITAELNHGEVPLVVDLRIPAKLRIGKTTTWPIVFKVECGITVDRLEKDTKIVGKDCDVKVKVF